MVAKVGSTHPGIMVEEHLQVRDGAGHGRELLRSNSIGLQELLEGCEKAAGGGEALHKHWDVDLEWSLPCDSDIMFKILFARPSSCPHC